MPVRESGEPRSGGVGSHSPSFASITFRVKCPADLNVNADGIWVEEGHGGELTALLAAVEAARPAGA